MTAKDSLEDKVIIIADHNEASSRLIESTLKKQHYSNTRRVDTGEQIYKILGSFNDEPEKIGLIILHEQLPHCQITDLQQCHHIAAVPVTIPLIILCENPSLTQQASHKTQSTYEGDLCHTLILPLNPQELWLAVKYLLKLRQERLAHLAEKERLLHDLSANSIKDSTLKFLASHDELTGLFNRNNFERRLKLALTRCHKLQKNAVLLFIEVERFGLFNEMKGFDLGDRLLVELSQLMGKLLPGKSLFARVGENEFCLLLEDMNKAQAQAYAESFKATIENHRFFIHEINHSVSLAIGLAALDDVVSSAHPGKIVMCARQASQLGQRLGQIGIYSVQDPVIKERLNDIYLAPLIQSALRENQLFLVFQPVVEINDGKISHYEVQLRMRHDGEVIQPNEFIPVAERMGLIHAIDLWVIENAIDFLAGLPSHRSDVSVAIKLSTDAFKHPDLIAFIQEKLQITWIDANRLLFDIAESAVLEHYEQALDMVSKLRGLGFKTAMKMSVTGFNAPGYVKTFPIDYVKIDGQFIKNLSNDENDQRLLKSVVDMINDLGKKTIFVYIESPYTVQKLRDLGVTLAQGYTLGKPESDLLEGSSIPFSQYIAERNRVEKALSEKESYLQVLIDNVPFQVWLKDTQSRFLAINRKLGQQLGMGLLEEIAGKTDFDFYPPGQAKQYQDEDREVLASRQRKTFEKESVDIHGAAQWTEVFLAPVIDKGGEPLGTLGFARDITERKQVESDLRIAATAFESQEGMVVTDADTVILKINHAFTRITGYADHEAIGRRMNILKSDVQDAAFYTAMWRTIQQSGNWQGEIWNRKKGGELYPSWLSITAVKTESGQVTHYVGTMIDITARKVMEEQMRHIAHHDMLTDLPNRILLSDRLQQSLAQAKRKKAKLALMYIDLDKFKPVNDNYGHEVGDLLLKAVASRLSLCLKRESDTVARLGGDEFVILLPNYDNEIDLARLAEAILKILSEPFLIEQNRIDISSSIGIATYPAHGIEVNALMKNADSAMYQAKHAGRSCYKFFD